MLAHRLIQLTWGLPQQVLGAAMYVALKGHARLRFRDAYVTQWGLPSGLSLGLFLFVPASAARSLLVHEYGHTIQSALLGPLYLPIVGLSSVIWANVPGLERWRRVRDVSYYAMPVERWANILGERVCGEKAPR